MGNGGHDLSMQQQLNRLADAFHGDIAEAPFAEAMRKSSLPAESSPGYLRAMFRELSRLVPGKTPEYGMFIRSAKALRQRRNDVISDEIFFQCNAILEKQLKEKKVTDKDLLDLSANMGLLIASALADEKAGIPHARPALPEWLADKDRFPENWIEAVTDAVCEIEQGIL
jgi:hypothetical protein